MLQYAIRGDEVRHVFRMLTAFTGVHISFWDAADRRLAEFESNKNLAYCNRRHRDRAFFQRCAECDWAGLRRARKEGRRFIYRCHHGLVEGIVPLHDSARHNLGAIMFGQIRLAEHAAPRGLTPTLRRLYLALPAYSMQRVEDLAGLLECLGDYFVHHHVVQIRPATWAESIREFVRQHVSEPIAMADLARASGRSLSFLSHRFAAEFGEPPHRFILGERMALARELLEKNLAVRQVALDLGYCDEFHFSKTFKAWHNCSPARYRSQVLASAPGPRPRLRRAARPRAR